jgi:uncharacterized protein
LQVVNLEGPVGLIEAWLNEPTANHVAPVGVALVAHPQPLLGGDAKHKVPHTMARSLAEAGWRVLRPQFRGVGRSAGAHDLGVGETVDLLACVAWLRAQNPGLPLALVGFSFGAFVLAHVATQLIQQGHAADHVVLLGMPSGPVREQRTYDTPGPIEGALVVHGERDEVVPLASMLDWARPLHHPVVVIPGADHAFSGKLSTLASRVTAHLRSSR